MTGVNSDVSNRAEMLFFYGNVSDMGRNFEIVSLRKISLAIVANLLMQMVIPKDGWA